MKYIFIWLYAFDSSVLFNKQRAIDPTVLSIFPHKIPKLRGRLFCCPEGQ